MTMFIKRFAQTKSSVNTPKTEAEDRRSGTVNAYRSLAVIQITIQLMLWLTLFCYDKAMQATWQAALMLIVPLAILWALWTVGQKGIRTKAGSYLVLLLLPCLLVDTSLLLFALTELMSEMVPSYSLPLHVVLATGICFANVCLSHENGVAYGANVMRWGLLGLFALGTVLLDVDVNGYRLWPLLGMGLGNTALTALAGSGSLWGVALLFILPMGKDGRIPAPSRMGESAKPHHTIPWTVLPWVLGFIWAMWISMTAPWNALDHFTVGEKLIGMALHSGKVLLSELTNVMWLLGMSIGIVGCATSGEKILRNVLPKMPHMLSAAAVLLPVMVLSLIFQDALLSIIVVMLPFRAVLSLMVAIGMIVISKKGAK